MDEVDILTKTQGGAIIAACLTIIGATIAALIRSVTRQPPKLQNGSYVMLKTEEWLQSQTRIAVLENEVAHLKTDTSRQWDCIDKLECRK